MINRTWLVMILMQSVLVLTYSQTLFPVYTGSGTHYENGYAIGSQAKNRIQQYINAYPPMKTLRNCLLTACSIDFRNLVEYNQQIYPQYFDELAGMSAGAEVAEQDLQLLTLKHEILALSNQITNAQNNVKSTLLECSDILLNNNSFKGFGHNEDGWNGTMNFGYYAHYHINSNDTQSDNEFFVFQYPASIAGHAFGVNIYGISVSMNAVFPNNVTIPARASYLLCRSVLDARNMSDAINIIHHFPLNGPVCSYGVSLNIGYLNPNSKKVQIANVEISPFAGSTRYYGPVDNEVYSYHYNMYLRLNVSQKQDESSIHRLNRTKQLIKENGLNDMNDILNILGDTNDDDYPLYRDSYPPDGSSTLATGIFDVENQMMYIYEKCNPKICSPAINVSYAFGFREKINWNIQATN